MQSSLGNNRWRILFNEQQVVRKRSRVFSLKKLKSTTDKNEAKSYLVMNAASNFSILKPEEVDQLRKD